MALIAPPEKPPLVALGDDDGRVDRVRLRLCQWWCTLVTVGVTVWLCTLGYIPGIIAVVTAKHILVAIFVMGIGVDAPREVEPRDGLSD
jgi:hypothetical protein